MKKAFALFLTVIMVVLLVACGEAHPFDTTNLSRDEINTLAQIFNSETIEDAINIATTNRIGRREDINLDTIEVNEAFGSISIQLSRDMYTSPSRTLQTMLEETRFILSRIQIREDVQEIVFLWGLPFLDAQDNEFYDTALMLRYGRNTLDNVNFRRVLTVTNDMIDYADLHFMHHVFQQALDS